MIKNTVYKAHAVGFTNLAKVLREIAALMELIAERMVRDMVKVYSPEDKHTKSKFDYQQFNGHFKRGKGGAKWR